MLKVHACRPRLGRRLALWGTLAAALWLSAGHAPAGETLDRVRAARVVRCGVSDGLPGFAVRGVDGRWSGMDVDFCRAVAAAVLGDPERTAFVPTTAAARFPLLKSRQIDILVRRTTWTLAREEAMQVHFAGTLFFDGQAFMVRRGGPVRSLEDLDGRTVCVVKETTHAEHLEDFLRARRMSCRILAGESRVGALEAYRRGECDAYSGDASALAALRALEPDGAAGDVILPERISKEFMGPVVNHGDEQWLTVVRWVLFALIEAEEQGVTQADARRLRGTGAGASRAALMDQAPGRALGLAGDWAGRVVESVGNYGEMFERHVGRLSPLGLERGLNRLWKEGGLMYAPPFR